MDAILDCSRERRARLVSSCSLSSFAVVRCGVLQFAVVCRRSSRRRCVWCRRLLRSSAPPILPHASVSAVERLSRDPLQQRALRPLLGGAASPRVPSRETASGETASGRRKIESGERRAARQHQKHTHTSASDALKEQKKEKNRNPSKREYQKHWKRTQTGWSIVVIPDPCQLHL